MGDRRSDEHDTCAPGWIVQQWEIAERLEAEHGEESEQMGAEAEDEHRETEKQKMENSNGLAVKQDASVERGGLTHRQWLFVEYFMGEAKGNGTKAARMAGYTGDENTLWSMASENLRKPEVASRIQARLAEVGVTTTALLHELASVAMAPTAHFMIKTQDEVYDDAGRKIRGAQMRLDYGAKIRALELLMRYRRMLDDRPAAEPTIKVLVGVDINRV